MYEVYNAFKKRFLDMELIAGFCSGIDGNIKQANRF